MDADRTVAALFAARPAFSDVQPGSAAYDYVTQLAARQIIKGYSPAECAARGLAHPCFGPADPIVRAQVAVLIVRSFGWDAESPPGPAPFADIDQVDPELQRAIAILAARGIVNGYGNGLFGPLDEVLHIQVVSFVTRALVQAGHWQAVTQDNPAIYPNVPLSSGHRLDLLTFVQNAGPIVDRPSGQNWADWDTPASRGWTALGLWQALNANGSFTYTPNAGFTGTDSFTYRASDGAATSGVATVTITVSPNDPAPTVTATTPANGATGVALDANLSITFSEAVAVAGEWFQIACATSGTRNVAATAVGGGPTTFTINPNANFATGESCMVTIVASQVTDQDTSDPFDAMLANCSFSFAAETPPAVTTTVPANGATTVAANTDITITFSEPVNVTGTWFQIVCPSGTRDTTNSVVGGGPTIYTIDPNADFVPGEGCTATVFAAQVTDQDGADPPDTMAADYTFTFGADAAPVVTATTPVDNATNVAIDTNLTITFSKPVNVGATWFAIACPTSGARTVGQTVVSGGPTTFTINPNADFAPGETCTVTVAAAQVSDQDANDPPDTMAADYIFSFTADAAPAVSTTTPADGATGVASNATITVNFSESVAATTSSFQIECPAASGARAFTIGASPASSYTLTPTLALPADTTCTVTVFAAQISDTDGNDPPDTMAADYLFSFTTDAAPSVTTTTPTTGAAQVASNTNVTVNFSESVNATTSSFTIECPAGSGTQAFALSASPATSFTLNPTSDLPAGTICTVTVLAAQITDTDSGDPPDNMVANHVFTFSIPPVATNDTYTPAVVGNVGVNTGTTGTTFSVLTNDVGTAPLAINTFSATSANGGTVAVAANGTFTYNPAPGFTGSDSFTYSISNAAGTSNTATVSITVTGLIWFINAGAGGPGDGRFGSPFNSIANFNTLAADEAGDSIFVYSHASAYTGAFTLLNNQRLIGQGAMASLSSIAGVTWNAHAGAEPTMSGTAPTIANVTLNSIGAAGANTVRGLTLAPTAGTALSGTTFGTLTVSEVTINATAQALSLTTGALATGGFTGITSTGGTNNILLSGVTTSGMFALGSGALSGATGASVLIDGLGGSFSYSGTIVNTTGTLSADIKNKTGGTVALSGTINAGTAGRGLAATGNTAGTITFSGSSKKFAGSSGTVVNLTFPDASTATVEFTGGGLEITGTGATIGFSATGSNGNDGTVKVQGSGNFIGTGTGTALTVQHVNIGTPAASEGGLHFRSIAATGAASGIVLNNTGSSGGLTVTGNSGTCTSAATCTGGAIQNSTGPGISLTSVGGGVSLTRMSVNNGGDDGIRGVSVNGFALDNSRVTDNGNAVNESGLDFVGGLTGTASITASQVFGSFENGMIVTNFSGSLNLTITGSTLNSVSTANSGNDGLHLDANDTANITVSVTGSTFSNNRGDHFQFSTNATSSGTNSVTFSNNTLTGDRGSTHGGTNLGAGITISPDAAADTTYTIANNNIQGAVGNAIAIEPGAASVPSGVTSGTISGNTIGTAGTTDSGSAQAAGIAAYVSGDGVHTTKIENNQIRQWSGFAGIDLLLRDGSPTLNATITGNTLANPGTFGGNGLLASAGAITTDAGTICAAITGNTLAGSGGGGATDFRLRQRFLTTVRLPGYGGAAGDIAAVVSFVQGNNPGVETGSATANFPAGGGGFVGGAACPQPSGLAGVVVAGTAPTQAPGETTAAQASQAVARRPEEELAI